MLLNFPVYYRCTNGLEMHQTGVVEAQGRMEWLAGLHPPSPESTAPLHDDGMLSRPWPITAPSSVFFSSILTIN